MVWGKPCGSRECPSGADGAIQPLVTLLCELLVQRAVRVSARSAPLRKIWHSAESKSLKNHANRVFRGATNEARAEDYQRPRAESMGDAVALPAGGGRYRARLERGSVSRRMRSALDRMSRAYRHTFGLR